jgi:DNA invertase Pin-like site-specific DNA recombinase
MTGVPGRSGRKRRFTREEIADMVRLYNDPRKPLSAEAVGRLFRCSYTTVLRAADGKLKAKDE